MRNRCTTFRAQIVNAQLEHDRPLSAHGEHEGLKWVKPGGSIGAANGRKRRTYVIAACFGGGLLTEPGADTWPRPQGLRSCPKCVIRRWTVELPVGWKAVPFAPNFCVG